MKKFLFVAGFAALSALTFSGCSKDDDNGSVHKVQYVVEGSSNVVVDLVIYTNANMDQTTKSGLTGQTYTSETLTIDSKKVPVLGVGSSTSTTDGASGKLTAKILVDGKVVATNESEGPYLSATATYSWD